MSAIHLNGNVWIIFPLRLGKCELWEHDRIHRRSREVLLVLDHVHILHVPMKRYRMMGDSVLRGDAVTRTMMWVVALHIHVWGIHVCGAHSFLILYCMFHTVGGLKWVFCRYANHECVNWILRLAICRECTCYATDIERDCHLRLAILWGRIGWSMHHHDCFLMYNCASLTLVPVINNLWINVCHLACVELDEMFCSMLLEWL
jgi:hypothetical protein